MTKLNRAVGIAGVVLLFGPAWAGPPNPTPSDNLDNTAGGNSALFNNTTGHTNTAFGDHALSSNLTGFGNSAVGAFALQTNSGSGNSAFGRYALYFNSTGNENSGIGLMALYNNKTGYDNTAVGPYTLESNTAGTFNTAVGAAALYSNDMGQENTAFGGFALSNNVIGNNNTAIGWGADIDCGNLDCSQVYIENATALGNGATLTESNSIVLGNGFIGKIYANVAITVTSDRRRKKDIRALDADLGLDFIEKLQPVSYRFNNGDETERYGFIAQDLEQALPASLHDTIERSEPEHGLALIERQSDKDRTYRVSYGELFAPIIKAIQQQQQEIEAERQQNTDLRRALEHQIAALKANAALRHSIRNQRAQVTAAR
jgi:hypothetical protein